MIEFCPVCSTKLEGDYLFCPKCGFKINNENDESSQISGSILICDNCGEENDINNIICSYCGIKLIKSAEQKSETGSPHDKPNKTELRKKSQKDVKSISKKDSKNSSDNNSKFLSSKTIFLILGSAFIGSLLIVIFSGILNKPEINPAANQNPALNSGVNLSNLNKINELETILKANPDDDETLLELAHLQNDSHFYTKAIENYKQYLDKYPENPDVRIDLGVCYYSLGDYNTAISEMEKALKYSPKHQIGHLNLGIVNLTAGNLEKSKEWLRKAISIDPNSEVGKRAKELLELH